MLRAFGGLPSRATEPSTLPGLPSSTLSLFSFKLGQTWFTCVACGIISPGCGKAKLHNILRSQKPVTSQGKNTLSSIHGASWASLGWAAPLACSLRKLWEAFGFPGVALAYLLDLAPGMRLSPRLLELMTERQ